MRPCKGYYHGCEVYCGTCAYYSICGVKELPKLPPQPQHPITATISRSAANGAGGGTEDAPTNDLTTNAE